jgi:sensor histidine kinase YesM
MTLSIKTIIAQKSLLIEKDLFKKSTNFPIIEDKKYSKDEAFEVLKTPNPEQYTDWGRAFRSYKTYWTGGTLINNTNDTIPILIEGFFEEIYVDGTALENCHYEPCKDPYGILKQGQLHATYIKIPKGNHTFIAKIGEYHLKYKFAPTFSDLRSFEGWTQKKEGWIIIVLTFYAGIFFLLCLISFLIFISTRDKAFLFYSLFCFGLLIHNIRQLGENFENYYSIDSYFPWVYAKFFWFLLLYGSYFMFAATLLKTKEENPEIYQKIIRFLKILGFFLIPELILLVIGWQRESYTIYFLLRHITNFFGVYILYLIYKNRKDYLSKFFLVGGSCLMFSEIFTSTFVGQVSTIIGFLGLTSETVVFSAALAYKIYYEFYQKIKLEQENTEKELTIEKLEKEKVHLNLSIIQSQLNPHFIFNCLNTVDAYILTQNRKSASHFLQIFSKLIRLVIENTNKEYITIEQDLEILKLYILLEEERSENQFKTTYEIDKSLIESGCKIPPMFLQPFVENAILHGLRHKKDADGELEISLQSVDNQLLIEITDNGIGRKASEEINKSRMVFQQSMGLEMTQQRIMALGELFNNPSEFQIFDLEQGTKVKIKIPKIL